MKSNKTYVVGDIHGGYKALMQCLEKANFDYQSDTLICLGDVCDGWPDTDKCLDELLKIKNLVYIIGNHDWWAMEWALTGQKDPIWLRHGGDTTLSAYPLGMPAQHLDILDTAEVYYLLEGNKLFVHGGFLLDRSLEEQNHEIFLWDRSLFRKAFDQYLSETNENITPYEEVYIGHTPTHQYGFDKPVQFGGIWLMDTGAGWTGPLSLMDVHSKTCFMSDPLPSLYPDSSGRMKA